MNRASVLIIFLFYFGFDVNLLAQQEVVESVVFDRAIENLLPAQEYDVDYNDLYDRLFSLYTNPLDLNAADRNEFHSLFFLTESQINALIDYREVYGSFLTIYELLYVDGYDDKTVQSLIPFVTVNQSKKLALGKSLSDPDIHNIFLRHQRVLETQRGYTPADTSNSGKLTNRYLGDPNRLYGRYLLAKKGRYSIGFTFEKDPGEQLRWDPETNRYGMDYFAFHLMLENLGFIKKIVVGDFNLEYGQGLVFGSGIRVGKGTEPITTIRRNNMGLRPYRSVYENKDFSGIALSTKLKQIELNIFYSIVNRDATRREDSLSVHDHFVSYIQTVGLHRTPNEVLAKHRLEDQSFGGNANFRTKNRRFELGINAIQTTYNMPIQPRKRLHNQFGFSGISNLIGGAYANYYFKNAHAFTEIAVSENGGKAVSSGVIVSPASQVQASLHYRNYTKDFHSFYGNAFGENIRIGNEQGLFWGLRIVPLRRFELTAYVDFFKFPWLKYRINAPSKGSDMMASATWQVSDDLNFRIQYRSKTTELNYTEEGISFPQVLPKTTERWLVHMNYHYKDRFSIQTRIQQSYVSFNDNQSTGFIIAQDAQLKYPFFSISGRFALFDSDSYDTRQFIYERDLLYVYSFPAFYNQGVRYYLVTSIELFKRTTLWFKIGQTRYFTSDSIGTGLEEIQGNKKTSIGTQLRIKL